LLLQARRTTRAKAAPKTGLFMLAARLSTTRQETTDAKEIDARHAQQNTNDTNGRLFEYMKLNK